MRQTKTSGVRAAAVGLPFLPLPVFLACSASVSMDMASGADRNKQSRDRRAPSDIQTHVLTLNDTHALSHRDADAHKSTYGRKNVKTHKHPCTRTNPRELAQTLTKAQLALEKFEIMMQRLVLCLFLEQLLNCERILRTSSRKQSGNNRRLIWFIS